MFNLENIVRDNILNMKGYSSARDEFSGNQGIFLDANENPYGELNRYPDPYQKGLKQALAVNKNVAPNQIFVGNGSDEVIELAFRIFCTPGKDKALTFSPTYGMYSVSANINNIQLKTLPLTDAFQIDKNTILPYLKDKALKLIFICSPNNPTGNIIDPKAIENILKNFKGIVIIDEAYIDFSTTPSWLQKIEQFPNLIVSQTFSKAYGLAAARVGVCYSNKKMIRLFNKVKPPYNVSKLNQDAALKCLLDTKTYQQNLELVLQEKEVLKSELEKIKIVEKIYPSDANFLLVKVSNADETYNYLVEKKIIVRNRNNVINNCIRIAVGTASENKKLIKTLQNA